jgi:ferric-dicitrate binding protein FerR (iron transport regulator)
MSSRPEPTSTMQAYAQAHGEPDPETSARLEQQLERIIRDDAARPARRRRTALLVVAIALVAGAGVGAGRWLAGASDSARGIIVGGQDGQRLALAAGELRIDPGSRARVLHDQGHGIVELADGAVEVEATAGGAGIQVVCGAYTVELAGARARIEHTGALPIITVHAGTALVRGAELPPGGVRILPVVPSGG